MSDIESPRFPDHIAYQSTIAPAFRTGVVLTQSGRAYRNKYWPQSLRSYELAHPVRKTTEIDELYDFFECIAQGRANRFRFRDPAENSATVANGRLGSGAGDGTPTYQLRKRRTAGATTYDRDIIKPVSGSVTAYRNASPITYGAGAGQIALDTTTGLVTFVADASSSATSITPGATTQVILSSNPGTLIAGQKLYLLGFTGADAALVNALAHTINSVTGSGPYTFTLATNTAGKTITLGSGSGRKYPQATDALTWAGSFDTPVRMDTDAFPIRPVGPGLFQVDSLPLIEDR